MKITVGVSARHVHLTEEIYEKLFGDTNLVKKADLDQPGQFASESVITIKNGDRQINNVRVIGPLRDYNQIEVSRTDCYTLKVNPPVRSSGDVFGSKPITLVGPKGEVTLEEGLIIASRHIHISKEEKERYGLSDINKVCIRVDGEKAGIMKNVYLIEREPSNFALHLDTDDANAFNIKTGDKVEVLIEKNNI